MKKLAISCRVLRSLGVGGWLLAVSVAMAAGMTAFADSGISSSAPEVWFRFDNPEVTGWQSNEGTLGSAVSFGGSYSAKGKNAGATYVETSDGYGVHSYSPWCNDISLGNVFTVSMRLQATTATNCILFCLGGLQGYNEALMLTTESAQSLKLVVVKGTEVLRQASIPVGDVTKWNTYVLRYVDGEVSANVEGVSESCCSINYTHTSGVFQLLGGYNKQDEMPEYYHGCGDVNSSSRVVTTADTANVICDFRIWENVAKITVGELQHMTAIWTSGDGTAKNAVSGDGFSVSYGTENVRVIFTPEEGFHLFGPASVLVGTVFADVALSKAQIPVAKQIVAGDATGSAVINSVTTRVPWTGEIDIDYEGVDIPEDDKYVSHINLQYRLSPADTWTNVPSEDYRQSSDWAEIVDGKLIHRIFNGVDRLTWDAQKTLGTGVLCNDAQVRIVVFDLGVLWEWNWEWEWEWEWDVCDTDSPSRLWPAKLLDLDLRSGRVAEVSDRPANLDELKNRALDEVTYQYRSRHMLFREVPAGFFKRGDWYWNFGGTAYVGVFRLTGDQYTMLTSGTVAGDQTFKRLSIADLRGADSSAGGDPLPGSLIAKLNEKISGSGWRVDVLPDYAYGQRLLWAGNSACPVTYPGWANEYGDFGTSPMAGGRRPSDWGFYDLVSGQEWTLSANDDGLYGLFGATSAAEAADQLNDDVRCEISKTESHAVRLVMWPRGTSLDVKEVPAAGFSIGAPTSVCLDTRSEQREITGTEAVAISYSGDNWGAGGSGVTVGYSWEGGAMQTVKEATDSGVFSWTPSLNGRYEFSHAVAGGVTNTAVFVVFGLPGCECDPWTVGDGVTAYVKDCVLYLNGTGEVAVASWTAYDEVLKGLGPLFRTITIPASVAATLPISVVDDTPSGAISGAEFERIDIVDGKAYLGVSVYTNSEVKVRGVGEDVGVGGEGAGWGVATNGVIEVPAPGKQGFFYLMSKPAVPSDEAAPLRPMNVREL